MEVKDKALLIKDLSSRLPYGVYVEHIRTGMRGHLHDLKVYPLYDKTDDHIYDYICSTDFLGDGDYFDIEAFKPLLFPLSSMNEEQKEELKREISKQTEIIIERMKNDDCGIDCGKYHFHSLLELEWCIKNHFDYMELIPKGLALDATGLNIY